MRGYSEGEGCTARVGKILGLKRRLGEQSSSMEGKWWSIYVEDIKLYEPPF